MSPLVKELLLSLGTEECIAATEFDARDITGDYDGMLFDEERQNYLRYIGQIGQ